MVVFCKFALFLFFLFCGEVLDLLQYLLCVCFVFCFLFFYFKFFKLHIHGHLMYDVYGCFKQRGGLVFGFCSLTGIESPWRNGREYAGRNYRGCDHGGDFRFRYVTTRLNQHKRFFEYK